MSIRITSTLSMNASARLQRTQKAIARSLARLGSGQRVNAQQDAPAYTLGIGLTSQIRGLAAANLGINRSIAMLETADSGLSIQMDIVQKMLELALRASNGTMSDTERTSLNEELQTLLSDYNRITESTQFDGTTLLNGSFQPIKIQLGTSKLSSINLDIKSSTASGVFVQSTTIGTGTFQNRITLASGAGPYNVRAADINGDGRLDLISPDYDANTVSIYLGNGNGTFQTRTTVQVGTNPTTALAFDFNADGKLDLATSDTTGNTVSILLGNGNGTFQTRTTKTAGPGAYDITAGDFDNDGDIDLATADIGGGNSISIFIGNGNGTFQNRTTKSAGTAPNTVITADLNNDNKLDLVTTSQNSDSISIFIGNGNGTFQNQVTKATGDLPYNLASADLTGDGYLDLVVADKTDGTISIFIGNGNGTFANRTTITTDAVPNSPVIADFNDDGVNDLLIGNVTPGTSALYIGNGNGTFQSGSTVYTGKPIIVIGEDLDEDGSLDIVAANYYDSTISVLLNNARSVELPTDIIIDSQENAENTLDILENALTLLAGKRAEISALHSRLDIAASYNLILSDNLTEARSNALDTDFALEVAELVRQQILEQVQVAVIAQANLSHKLVTKLLTFKN